LTDAVTFTSRTTLLHTPVQSVGPLFITLSLPSVCACVQLQPCRVCFIFCLVAIVVLFPLCRLVLQSVSGYSLLCCCACAAMLPCRLHCYVLHHSPGSGSLKQRAATIISAAAGRPAHTHNQVDCSALFAFCVSVRASFVCIVARCCCLVVCIVSVHPSHLTFPTFCVLVAATRQLQQGVGTMQHSATAAVATPTMTSEAMLLCTALHWRRAPALQLHCDLW